ITVKLRLQRHEKDFTGKVTILPAASGPLRVNNAEIAPGQDEATVTVDVPANAPAGEHTLTVLGQAQVPYSKDPKAAQRPNVLVPLPAGAYTRVVTPKKGEGFGRSTWSARGAVTGRQGQGR